jgi:hypothetical protein
MARGILKIQGKSSPSEMHGIVAGDLDGDDDMDTFIAFILFYFILFYLNLF